MAFTPITLSIDRAEALAARYNATPHQLERAIINSLDQQAREANNTIIRKIGTGTGVPRREVKRRTRVKRFDKKRRPYSAVGFSGQRIPLKHWDWQYVVPDPRQPTRAYVLIKNTITGRWDKPYAFVNPFGKQAPQATLIRNSPLASDVEVSAGVSIRRPFAESVDTQLLTRTRVELRARVLENIQKQIRKGEKAKRAKP